MASSDTPNRTAVPATVPSKRSRTSSSGIRSSAAKTFASRSSARPSPTPTSSARHITGAPRPSRTWHTQWPSSWARVKRRRGAGSVAFSQTSRSAGRSMPDTSSDSDSATLRPRRSSAIGFDRHGRLERSAESLVVAPQ